MIPGEITKRQELNGTKTLWLVFTERKTVKLEQHTNLYFDWISLYHGLIRQGKEPALFKNYFHAIAYRNQLLKRNPGFVLIEP